MRRWSRTVRRVAAGSTLLVATACLLGAAIPVPAQTGQRPALADHEFVSTDVVPDAFVRTYVRTNVGAAIASGVHYPVVVVAGDTLATLNGDLAYARLDAEYQQKLRDWIAFRFAFGLRSRLGTKLASIVTEGVTVASGYDFGWLARLHEGRKTSLCGSVAVSNQYITIVDVKQFAEDVANGVKEARLTDTVPTVRSDVGLRFAWAISRPFGVTAVSEASYGDSPRRRDADSWEYNFGVSVDFDARPVWSIPLGAALAYRQTSLPAWSTEANGNSSETVLRLAYNAKSDLLVAIDFHGVFSRDNARAAPVWAGGASLSTRCYF
jgi:hypothetical protein